MEMAGLQSQVLVLEVVWDDERAFGVECDAAAAMVLWVAIRVAAVGQSVDVECGVEYVEMTALGVAVVVVVVVVGGVAVLAAVIVVGEVSEVALKEVFVGEQLAALGSVAPPVSSCVSGGVVAVFGGTITKNACASNCSWHSLGQSRGIQALV